MVNTGARSSIISHSTLHSVVHQQGREEPQLELPTARLYGKDGKKGGMELKITAQVTLTVNVDDRSVMIMYSLIVHRPAFWGYSPARNQCDSAALTPKGAEIS